MNMTYTGAKLTQSFESCRLVAYQDSRGTWTIGWGHTAGVHAGMTCTQAQADSWLQQDMAAAVRAVNAAVKVVIDQDMFNALVDFAFNCGAANLDGSTLLRLINGHDFKDAAAQFDRWDEAGGKVVAGLLRRRQAETAEFQQGIQELQG